MKNAVCDVIIVQTSALDEDRVLGEQLAKAPAGRAGSVKGSAPGG